MSVNPGLPAQKFIPSSPQKIARMRDLLRERGSDAVVEVDGGVNADTAPLVAGCGRAGSRCRLGRLRPPGRHRSRGSAAQGAAGRFRRVRRREERTAVPFPEPRMAT